MAAEIRESVKALILSDLKNCLAFTNGEGADIYWHFDDSNILKAEVFDDALPGESGEKYEVEVRVVRRVE